MPSGKNWALFIYLNLAFAIYIATVFYYNQVAKIKENWPLYRCNPMYMPLADNATENLQYCIQTTMSNYMGYLLQPLTFATGSLGTMVGNQLDAINSIRAMFDKVRTLTSTVIESVFGVFLNLVIEFERIIIGIKDLMGKTIGIVVSLMYIMDGSIKTMNSTWNGPPGQMVRSLGKCFHPETKIKLITGEIKSMKDINLGDVLENGSIVESTLRIDNKRKRDPFYVIEGSGVDGENIYVTGSHLILDNNSKTFVRVDNCLDSKLTNIVSDYFSCLITSDHAIQIGSRQFWDWEDHFIKTTSCFQNV
jgi:hypothetical protein